MSDSPGPINGRVVHLRTTQGVRDLAPRAYVGLFALIVVVAALLRGMFPLADPPWETPVGVVWHDEGAWTHNARNKALWGAWTVTGDNWNPMYVAPVFTGLEYASFEAFGVGLWQARVVSMLAGILAVVALGAGVARLGGRAAGIIAAALLATNYVWVMYSRAAIMEATMVAFCVAGWWAFVRATTDRHAGWAIVSATCAWLAYFTKASAVFFVAALGLVCVAGLIEGWWVRRLGRAADGGGTAGDGKGAEGAAHLGRPSGAHHDAPLRGTLLALGGVGVLAFLAFVLPNLTDYVFYNWQMSVTRKPSYTLKALADRVSWFPVVHDIFTRMWFTFVVALTAGLGILVRWRETAPGERLLLAWIGIGSAELLLHDVGNERRLVFLVPALIGVAAIALGRDGRLVPSSLAGLRRAAVVWALPLMLYVAYLAVGSLARVAFLYQIGPSVRLSAVLAVVAVALLVVTWPRVPRLLAGRQVGVRAALGLAGLLCAGDIVQYAQWASGRTYENYGAMRLVAERLPPGTVVQGKLANGLALESRIVPVFVGRNFGNYDDRFRRDDARFILTYVKPWVGYEGAVITEVLDAYPRRRVRWMVPVAESGTGEDMAALIEKNPPPEVSGAHD